MVSMPVADHDVVDPLQSRFLSGCEDSLGIAVTVAWITGVEQERVSGRRDEQRRRAALDVDPVDLQVACSLRGEGSLTGNFRPRSLFNQTRHGKNLIGGYLSRVSPNRVDRMRRQFPTLDALIKLSEKAPIGTEVEAVLRERGNRLVTQANLGYVVIDSRFITPERAQLVIDAFRLRELQRDAHLTLYEPVIGGR